jgi:hypothetical protein
VGFREGRGSIPLNDWCYLGSIPGPFSTHLRRSTMETLCIDEVQVGDVLVIISKNPTMTASSTVIRKLKTKLILDNGMEINRFGRINDYGYSDVVTLAQYEEIQKRKEQDKRRNEAEGALRDIRMLCIRSAFQESSMSYNRGVFVDYSTELCLEEISTARKLLDRAEALLRNHPNVKKWVETGSDE